MSSGWQVPIDEGRDQLEEQEFEAERRRDREADYTPARPLASMPPGVYVVCDGPPGPESGRFVETEDEQGRGVGPRGVGWRQRADGMWALGPFRAPAVEDVGGRYVVASEDPDAHDGSLRFLTERGGPGWIARTVAGQWEVGATEVEAIGKLIVSLAEVARGGD